MSKLNSQIISGIAWNALRLVIEKSFSFIIKLVLARLLFPEDFGIVGMATVFISFIGVFNELGIGAALVQRREEDLNENHFHTAFWTGVGWAIFIYLIVSLVVAPLAADFYNEPIIETIIPVLGLGILSSPINLVHKAQLTKALNFKKIAFISNSSGIFAGVLSLVLAYLGAGVWSLVFNSVATIVVGIPLYFKATGWRPKFIWHKKEFIDIFGFGIYTTGTSIFNTILSKLDYLIIGKMLSAPLLGVYTLSFLLTDTFRSQLIAVMNKVMYPVYGKIQESKSSLKNYYLKIVVYNSAIVYPLMIIFLIIGEPLVLFIFGEKWQDGILSLRILSVAVMFSLMVNSHTSLIRGMGKPKLELKLQFFRAVFIYIPLVYFGTKYFGIVGTAMAVLFHKFCAVFIASYVLNKLIGLKPMELLTALRGPLLGTTFSIITGYISFYILNLHFILVGVIICATYLVTIYFLMKKDLTLIIEQLKNSRKSLN